MIRQTSYENALFRPDVEGTSVFDPPANAIYLLAIHVPDRSQIFANPLAQR